MNTSYDFSKCAVSRTAFTLIVSLLMILALQRVASAQSIEISISDNPDPVMPGEVLTYTVVANNGPNYMFGVAITDVLDMNVHYITATNNPIYHPTSNFGGEALEWYLADIPSQSTIQETVIVTVDSMISGTMLNNMVMVVQEGQLVAEGNENTLIVNDGQTDGHITGYVHDAMNNPLEGIMVEAYSNISATWMMYQESWSNNNGYYDIAGLPDDTYRVCFIDSSQTYEHQCYSYATDIFSATDIVVSSGAVITGINGYLNPIGGMHDHGVVNGHVSNVQQTPLMSIEVGLYSEYDNDTGEILWHPMYFGMTDANGYFEFTGLVSDTYRVGFMDYENYYLTEFYDDVHDVMSATDIFVMDGMTTTIDAMLDVAGAISGTVTDDNGILLPYIQVQVFDTLSYTNDYSDTNGKHGWSSQTDEFGRYHVGGLPTNEYYVEFIDSTGQHLPEFYNNVTNIMSATLVSVMQGQTTPDVDAVLSSGGSIEGIVTNNQNEPLGGIKVTAYVYDISNETWDETGFGYTVHVSTNAFSNTVPGSYSIGALADGMYRIGFYDYQNIYAGEYYDDATTIHDATDIIIFNGATVSGIDAVLSKGGHITGTIATEDGQPFYEIESSVYQHDSSTNDWELVRSMYIHNYTNTTTTTDTFFYDIGGLATGVYRLGFYDYSNRLQGEFYDDATDVYSATDISVIAEQTTPDINVVLSSAPQIWGTVSCANGVMLDWGNVEANQLDGTNWIFVNSTDVYTDGNYQLHLNYGTYRIHFSGQCGDVYHEEYYNNAADIDSADDIIIQGDMGIPNISAVLGDLQNYAPHAEFDEEFTDEDMSIMIDVLWNDHDPDGDHLTLLYVGQGMDGNTHASGNVITYTPNLDFNGTDIFSYTITDGDLIATAGVTVTVYPVNDPPVADDMHITTDEDTEAHIQFPVYDDDFSNLTIGFDNPANGYVEMGSTYDHVIYTPNENFFGDDSFSYFAHDGEFTTTAVVSINVLAINDAPNVHDDSYIVDEDTILIADVLANDYDFEGDVLSITDVIPSIDGHATTDGNTVTFTPTLDFNGITSFEYTVSDNEFTIIGTAIITVTAVNDAPESYDDFAITAMNVPRNIAVLGNDYDVDGDVLFVADVGAPTNGTVTIDNTGINYAPSDNFVGMDVFTYTASDGELTDMALVTVTVEQSFTNTAPEAIPDQISTLEDTAVMIDVLFNDFDIDGDTLSIESVEHATNGTATFNASSITYEPFADFNGSDIFTYTINDGQLSSSAQVYIYVESVNDLPVANDDNMTVDEDGFVTVDVLANDTDVDGDMLTVSNVEQATNGEVYFNANGGIVYEPFADFNGSDSFIYHVTDVFSETASATVFVTVYPVNDAPDAYEDFAQTAENTQLIIEPLLNDSDRDSLVFTIIAVDDPQNGMVSFDDSTITYNPDANFFGHDIFNYTISDGELTATARIEVAVYQLHRGLLFIKTVGANPTECANTFFVFVDKDSEVTYCYEVNNTGEVTFDMHDLADDKLGMLLDDFTYSLAPGEFYMFTTTAIITQDTVNNAVWYATDINGNVISRTASAHVEIGETDLYVSKWLNMPVTLAGSEIEYQIYYSNWSEYRAYNVQVTDILPTNLSYVNYSVYTWDENIEVTLSEVSGNTVMWTIPELGAWQSGYINVIAHISDSANEGDLITNTITIESNTPDDNPDNNSYTHVTEVQVPHQDVAIEKYTYGTAEVGGFIDYYLYYYNAGNTEVSDIIITDTLPVGTTFIDEYNYEGVTAEFNGNTIVWHVPSLLPYWGGSIQVTVQVSDDVATGTELVNAATISSAGTDAHPENNIYAVSQTVYIPGSISGIATDPDGNPATGAWVSIYHDADGTSPLSNTNESWSWAGGANVDANGFYQVDGLESGEYILEFFYWPYPSEFYNDVTEIISATNVGVFAGQTTAGIDVQFNRPVPPIASGSSETGFITNDPTTGELEVWVNVYQPSDLTVTKEISCTDGSIPTDVTLILETDNGAIVNYAMDFLEGYMFSAVIPADQLESGTLSVSYSCFGVITESDIGHILIDPSGFITDAETGEPIVNAKVTLYKLDNWTTKESAADIRPNTCHTLETRGDITWNKMVAAPEVGRPANPAADPQEIDPTVNPFYTDSTGYYSWDVSEGCWYIVVEADGYETRVSPAVGIPPEVTDLDLTMYKHDSIKVEFSLGSYFATESDGTVTIDVTLSNEVNQEVTVKYRTSDLSAKAGEDYTILSGNLTFEAGEIAREIEVPLLDDKVSESTETFKLILSNPVNAILGGRSWMTLTITDDDEQGTQITNDNVIYLPIVLKW